MSKSLASSRTAGPGTSTATRAPAPAVRQDPLGNAARVARTLGAGDEGKAGGGAAGGGAARERFPHQKEMEALFGEDFSGVEVVFGAAGAMAELGASAAAEGERIQFAAGVPDKEMVAHELAHVVQRRHSGGEGTGVSDPGDGAEREATRVGKDAAAGKQVSPRARATAGTMRFTPAKQDAYNDKSIDNNGADEGKDLRQRPGVVYKGEDTFKTLKATMICFGSGEDRTELAKGVDVCINPAEPRKLNGHTCLLVWAGTTGAGWVRASDIDHGYDLVREIKYNERYQDWQPSAANKKQDKTIFLFKTSGPTTAAELGDKTGDRVFPNQKSAGANKVAHHLKREGTKSDASDDYYNVFMNLPQKNAAAVAYDVAQPGEEFHAPKNAQGHFLKRHVETFDKGSDKAKEDVTFVFGYVGGSVSRRGWVVYDCLERKS